MTGNVELFQQNVIRWTNDVMMSASTQDQKPLYRSIVSLICSIIQLGNNEKYRKINYLRKLKRYQN